MHKVSEGERAMKTIYPVILLLVAVFLAACVDKDAAARKAKEDAAAKARAEAARKEMETVPKVFRPQYHNKRLEPEPLPGAEKTPAARGGRRYGG